jgi:hypothetical protein
MLNWLTWRPLYASSEAFCKVYKFLLSVHIRVSLQSSLPELLDKYFQNSLSQDFIKICQFSAIMKSTFLSHKLTCLYASSSKLLCWCVWSSTWMMQPCCMRVDCSMTKLHQLISGSRTGGKLEMYSLTSPRPRFICSMPRWVCARIIALCGHFHYWNCVCKSHQSPYYCTSSHWSLIYKYEY